MTAAGFDWENSLGEPEGEAASRQQGRLYGLIAVSLLLHLAALPWLMGASSREAVNASTDTARFSVQVQLAVPRVQPQAPAVVSPVEVSQPTLSAAKVLKEALPVSSGTGSPKTSEPTRLVAQTPKSRVDKSPAPPVEPQSINTGSKVADVVELDQYNTKPAPLQEEAAVETPSAPETAPIGVTDATTTVEQSAPAGMRALDDEELAGVRLDSSQHAQSEKRWRLIQSILKRIELEIYQAWHQDERWSGELEGVLRFELDETGRLSRLQAHLASDDQAFDDSIRQAVFDAIAEGTEDTRRLAQLNFRYFRFSYSARGPRIETEFMPWEVTARAQSDKNRDSQL